MTPGRSGTEASIRPSSSRSTSTRIGWISTIPAYILPECEAPRRRADRIIRRQRWHKSLKGECIRPGMPLSLDDARRLVEGYVEHYNNVRPEQRGWLHH